MNHRFRYNKNYKHKDKTMVSPKGKLYGFTYELTLWVRTICK